MMIFDLWWGPGDATHRFLADIKAPESIVEDMIRRYNTGHKDVSFVTFLRQNNIPARNIDPIRVRFYTDNDGMPELAQRC